MPMKVMRRNDAAIKNQCPVPDFLSYQYAGAFLKNMFVSIRMYV